MSLNSQFLSVCKILFRHDDSPGVTEEHRFLQSLDYYVVNAHMGRALYFLSLQSALYGVSVGQDYRANQGG